MGTHVWQRAGLVGLTVIRGGLDSLPESGNGSQDQGHPHDPDQPDPLA